MLFRSADPVHLGPAFLRAARDRAEASRSGLVAMLVVPLPSSEELILRAPDFAEVASAAWKYGPGREVVGLYLLEPRVLTVHEPAEEYRCDVDASDVVGRGPSVYFRSWRTPSDAANGWGFSQAFYVRLHG